MKYYKLEADDIATILDLARKQAEKDGYEYFPNTLLNGQELSYIQQVLEAAQ
jgi:hypothetical protein